MKVILNENMLKELMLQEAADSISVKDMVNSDEFKKKVNDLIKNDPSIQKDQEKLIKKAVAKCVSELFKTLWQKDAFWKSVIEQS